MAEAPRSNRPTPRTPAAAEAELRRRVRSELEHARGEAEDGQIDDATLAAIIARAVASALQWHLEAPEHSRNATLSSRSWRPAGGPRGRAERDFDRPNADEDRPPRGFDRRPRRDYDGPPREYGRPPRDIDDRPPRDYGRPRRDFDDRPPRDFDRPRRDVDDRPPRRPGKPFRGGGFKRRPQRGR
jgi:hypothetical protein